MSRRGFGSSHIVYTPEAMARIRKAKKRAARQQALTFEQWQMWQAFGRQPTGRPRRRSKR